MNDELVAFLRARLDEDEQDALVTGEFLGPCWVADGHDVYTADEDALRIVERAWTRGVAAHAARHDPARVLREVKAKRRVLGRHQRLPDPRAGYGLPDVCGLCDIEWPCPELIDLAYPYDDHPDYRPEWVPAE